MKRLSLAVTIAISMWACDGGRRSSNPISPSPPPAAGPTYTLSGMVFELTPTAQQPVEGARVQLVIGSLNLDAVTDPNGFYSMTVLHGGIGFITTTRNGYEVDTRKVTISGDVRLDIGVVPRVPHTVSGVVFEMTSSGQVPIEGAYVTGPWDYPVNTDSNGIFSLSVCGDSPCLFYEGDKFNAYISKDGYQPVIKEVTVNGDTRLDIQLVRR
jgi:hypothetical protein